MLLRSNSGEAQRDGRARRLRCVRRFNKCQPRVKRKCQSKLKLLKDPPFEATDILARSQRILAYELRKAKFDIKTEVPIPVKWDGHEIEEGFRADLIVNDLVLIELKSVETISKVHHKQTLTYLKLNELQLGL